MLTVSVSILENFRQFRDNDKFYDVELMPEDKLISYITDTAEKSDKADIGIAFHEILQNPDESYNRFSKYYKKSGFRSSTNIDFSFELITQALEHINSKSAFEVKMEKTYTVCGKEITVKGRADSYYGSKIDDFKLTIGDIYNTREGEVKRDSKFDYDKFHRSLQHRFYLDLFQADIFEYIVFDALINKLNDGIMEFEEIHHFQFYRNPEMDIYIKELLSDFINWVEFKGLQSYFGENKPKEAKPILNGKVKQEEYSVDEAMDDLLGDNDSILNIINSKENKMSDVINLVEDTLNSLVDETLDDLFGGIEADSKHIQLAGRGSRTTTTVEPTPIELLKEPIPTAPKNEIEPGNKIHRVDIKNILGIESLVLTPNGVTVVSGQNGQGKTSVIKAIKAALGGGYDAELIRKGADKGQVVIELENGFNIKKTINQKGGTLSVTQNGRKVDKPQALLSEIFKQFGTNPLDLLIAPAKMRVDILLDAIKLELSKEEFDEAISGIELSLDYNLKDHALDVLESVRKQVSEERKGAKRILDIKEKGYANASANVFEVTGNPEELSETLKKLDAQKVAMEVRKNDFLAKYANERETAIDKAVKVKQAAIEEAQKVYDASVAKIDTDIELKRASLNSKFDVAYNPLISEIEKNKAAYENIAGIIAQTNQLKSDLVEIKTLQSDVGKLTTVIGNLDNLKETVKGRLPIPGIEIRGEEIFKDGIAFEHLNTAEQMKLCIEIGRLHNTSGLMLVDGIERLDQSNQALLLKLANENGLQLIVTEVSEEPNLNIKELGA